MRRKFGPRYRVPFKRRREGKTDYRARYKMLLSGKIRAVVRKSLRHIVVQFIKAEMGGDKTLFTTWSTELKKYGWKYGCGNLPAAYLTGYLAGLKALKAGINEAILDLGPQRSTRGNRLYAVLRGLLDAGVEVPYGEGILPDISRIKGEHIVNYAKLLKEEDSNRYNKQFSGYIAKGLDPENIPNDFEKVLNNIAREFNVAPPELEEGGEEKEFEEG